SSSVASTTPTGSVTTGGLIPSSGGTGSPPEPVSGPGPDAARSQIARPRSMPPVSALIAVAAVVRPPASGPATEPTQDFAAEPEAVGAPPLGPVQAPSVKPDPARIWSENGLLACVCHESLMLRLGCTANVLIAARPTKSAGSIVQP